MNVFKSCCHLSRASLIYLFIYFQITTNISYGVSLSSFFLSGGWACAHLNISIMLSSCKTGPALPHVRRPYSAAQVKSTSSAFSSTTWRRWGGNCSSSAPLACVRSLIGKKRLDGPFRLALQNPMLSSWFVSELSVQHSRKQMWILPRRLPW